MTPKKKRATKKSPPKPPERKKKPSENDRYPQLTVRMDHDTLFLVERHRKAREMKSRGEVCKEALELYFALDLPSWLIQRLSGASKAKREPLTEWFAAELDSRMR